MNYQETLEYLFNSLPIFSRVGAPAYKEGLETTFLLDKHWGHPHRKFRVIHIAGTNGKGSTAQMIYESLRSAGHSVGLYTSPHLIDFRERIVVDDEKIDEQYVVGFVDELRRFMATNPALSPSFFEMSVAMAFDYFATKQVHYAVVEVGMGGRLDSTNIVKPELSVITNISIDHVQFLGSTLPRIAEEKAGIIKLNTPVVVGETHPETEEVFRKKAKKFSAPITFADRVELETLYKSTMQGDYQLVNARTAQVALTILGVPPKAIKEGISKAKVRGRWEVLAREPLTVCDTGHNKAGIAFIVDQLSKQEFDKLYFIFGVVADKEITTMLRLLPRDAYYIFTNAAIPRALAADELAQKASASGLHGCVCANVEEAVLRARALAGPRDMIFIGGSTFVVAEAITHF